MLSNGTHMEGNPLWPGTATAPIDALSKLVFDGGGELLMRTMIAVVNAGDPCGIHCDVAKQSPDCGRSFPFIPLAGIFCQSFV